MEVSGKGLRLLRSLAHTRKGTGFLAGGTFLAILVVVVQMRKSCVTLKAAGGSSYGVPTQSQILPSNDGLCAIQDEIDITDDRVLSLNVPLSPDFPVKHAWFKCEAARYGKAPEDVPQVLYNDFTLHGSIPIKKHYFSQAYLGGNATVAIWTEGMINEYIEKVQKRHQKFNYNTEPIYQLFDARPNLVANKVGLVIGSENPWLESLLLHYGAKEIHTVEFGSIISEYAKIKAFTPDVFKFKFLNGEIAPYDFAFSYSSLEHDGLGRYGDILNPIGDLQSMAKLLSLVRPGGHVAIGVPCCHDRLDWNAHRIYGPIRLPLLFAGFQILGIYPSNSRMSEDTSHGFQPIWLLKNQLACSKDMRVSSILTSRGADV